MLRLSGHLGLLPRLRGAQSTVPGQGEEISLPFNNGGCPRLALNTFLGNRWSIPIPPPDQGLSIFSRPFVCHPDQASEAQAEANARRDRREAICLKTRGKKEIAPR